MSVASWIRLELNIGRFDESAFAYVLEQVMAGGITLTTFAGLGNTAANQRLLYDLNAECAADIPDRGRFFSWDEYRRARIDVPSFDPHGVVVACEGEQWVGLAATSDHRQHGFVFNEMTGVIRTHRRRGVALAMKVHGLTFPRRCGVQIARTVHHPRNEAMIELNRRLGYMDADWALPPIETPAA